MRKRPLKKKAITRKKKLETKLPKPQHTELAVIRQDDDKAVIPDISRLEKLAKFLHQSRLFPDVKSVADAITKIEYGREIGIRPVQALSTIWIIKGVPTVKTQVMIALAISKGIRFKVLKSDETICQIEFSRPGFDPHIETFTIEDAEKLKYTDKTAYVQQPKIMNRYRCFSNGLRIYAPDLMLNLYSREEIDMADTIEVHVQDEAEPKKDEEQKQKALDEEKDSLVEDIKYKVAKKGIDLKEFKEFLETFQATGCKEPREFISYKFGSRSLSEGKLDDLKVLLQNLEYVVTKFNEWKSSKGKDAEKPEIQKEEI